MNNKFFFFQKFSNHHTKFASFSVQKKLRSVSENEDCVGKKELWLFSESELFWSSSSVFSSSRGSSSRPPPPPPPPPPILFYCKIFIYDNFFKTKNEQKKKDHLNFDFGFLFYLFFFTSKEFWQFIVIIFWCEECWKLLIHLACVCWLFVDYCKFTRHLKERDRKNKRIEKKIQLKKKKINK